MPRVQSYDPYAKEKALAEAIERHAGACIGARWTNFMQRTGMKRSTLHRRRQKGDWTFRELVKIFSDPQMGFSDEEIVELMRGKKK